MTVNIAPGIPFGISFIGRRWSEETLKSFSYAFEQRTIARRKMRPFLHPTFDLGDRILHANEVRLSTQPPAAPPASTRPTFNPLSVDLSMTHLQSELDPVVVGDGCQVWVAMLQFRKGG